MSWIEQARHVADAAAPAFAYGEPSFENYTERYVEQLAEFQLLFQQGRAADAGGQ